jgi:hypothetical protein
MNVDFPKPVRRRGGSSCRKTSGRRRAQKATRVADHLRKAAARHGDRQIQKTVARVAMDGQTPSTPVPSKGLALGHCPVMEPVLVYRFMKSAK